MADSFLGLPFGGQAAEINLVGCQFGPKDASLWKRTGHLFLALGPAYYQKAQYCFGRAISVRPLP